MSEDPPGPLRFKAYARARDGWSLNFWVDAPSYDEAHRAAFRAWTGFFGATRELEVLLVDRESLELSPGWERARFGGRFVYTGGRKEP